MWCHPDQGPVLTPSLGHRTLKDSLTSYRSGDFTCYIEQVRLFLSKEYKDGRGGPSEVVGLFSCSKRSYRLTGDRDREHTYLHGLPRPVPVCVLGTRAPPRRP